MIKSLQARQHRLAQAREQLELLNGGEFANGELPTFKQKLDNQNHFPLKAKSPEILQLNVGYMCNQTCKHCHVDAGPDRKEIMIEENMRHCLRVLNDFDIDTLDLTGGAPEMHPQFRWFVEEARKTSVREIIVRSNLTIILANKKYHDLPDFFKKHKLRVVSSLPFYKAAKTDRQRGDGVFDKSIKALKMLNAVGYGQAESGLLLDLVYNPAGAFLPAAQAQLEADFKRELKKDHGIEFNSLLTITNLPISRFLDYLLASDNYEEYMEKLVEAYNPAAVESVMCRNTISVSWDGIMYDCDFNQMLEMPIAASAGKHISEYDPEKLEGRNILVNQHCYGCTAGAGSSCQGSLV